MKKNIIIVIVSIIIALVIVLVSVGSYVNYQNRQDEKRRQAADQQDVINKNLASDEARLNAQRAADLSRLQSICMEALDRYNKLPAASQVKETKPDCTIHVQ